MAGLAATALLLNTVPLAMPLSTAARSSSVRLPPALTVPTLQTTLCPLAAHAASPPL
jgi:hypothetical protein